MTGKRITLDEIVAEQRAKRLAEMATPEFKEREARNAERYRQEEAARLKWEAENPRTARELGAEAAANDEDREAPEGLDADEWLAGYDEERGTVDDEGDETSDPEQVRVTLRRLPEADEGGAS